MVRPDQNHSARLMKRLALSRQKAVDFTKRAPGRAKGFDEIGSATLDWIRES